MSEKENITTSETIDTPADIEQPEYDATNSSCESVNEDGESAAFIKKCKKIRETFRRIIRKPYYYVPPCPVCNSLITGRFLKLHGDVDSRWVINESLRNGEIVVLQHDLPFENCFCLDCNYSWFSLDAKLKFIPLIQIDEEKRARHTSEIYAQRIEKYRDEKKNWGTIKRFMGEI